MKHLKQYELTTFFDSNDIFRYISRVDLPKIKELIKDYPDMDINIKNTRGDTPLIDAIRNSTYQIFNFLIDSGADINMTDNYGNTPLMLCARNKRDEAVEILINSGANINAQNDDGDTPLIICSQYRDKAALKTIKILIDNDADWNIIDNLGHTFMVYLTSIFRKEIIEKYPDKYKNYLMVMTANKFNI